MNKKFLFAGMIVFALIATLFTPSAALFDKFSTDPITPPKSSQPGPPANQNAYGLTSFFSEADPFPLMSESRSEDRTPIFKCGDISTDTTWVADT